MTAEFPDNNAYNENFIVMQLQSVSLVVCVSVKCVFSVGERYFKTLNRINELFFNTGVLLLARVSSCTCIFMSSLLSVDFLSNFFCIIKLWHIYAGGAE